MLLRDYTKTELDWYIANGNFTDSELQYLMLKSKDKSNVQISFEMNISERQVVNLAKRVRSKIVRM